MQAGGIQGGNFNSFAVLPQTSAGTPVATPGAQGTGGAQTRQAVAQAQQATGGTSGGGGARSYNANAPRGSYVNMLV